MTFLVSRVQCAEILILLYSGLTRGCRLYIQANLGCAGCRSLFSSWAAPFIMHVQLILTRLL